MVKLAAPRGHLWSCLTLTFAFAGVTIRFPRDWYLIIYFASHCKWIFEDEMLPHQVSASLRAQNIQKISKHQASARPPNVQIGLVHCVSVLQILRHVWPLHFNMTKDRCQVAVNIFFGFSTMPVYKYASGTYTDALAAYLVSLCRVRKTWLKVVGLNNLAKVFVNIVGLNNFTSLTCTCTLPSSFRSSCLIFEPVVVFVFLCFCLHICICIF